ncbi:hypothetical protein GGQ98_002631 [Sphingosinicella soli]|uniref:Nucleotidyltransferase family protein n=1 Tax=Sphingosinicella soli TaxID=333708 RepID=A0A7W7B4Y8_9SPHN|nr:hypothetical protein [Sphingosinicella soli]
MIPAAILHRALAEPESMRNLSADAWNALIRVGRAERLLGTVAARAAAVWDALPQGARTCLAEERDLTRGDHLAARWEIDRAALALKNVGCPVILMKGSAYLHAGLPAAEGRRIGDLDILVPRAALPVVEAALIARGWMQAKENAYDDHYYRAWMHEIPPMVHTERGGVIDVHHTILPLTARLRPDADALIESRVAVADGLFVLGPAEMLLHSAAHVAYDGEFEGGNRNLWDIHCLATDFSRTPGFWDRLAETADRHQLRVPVSRALRLARRLYGTAVPEALAGRIDIVDRLALRKLYWRDRFGHQGAKLSDRLLYVRGHWLRMPPLMLARHLTRKAFTRKAQAQPV